MSTDRDKATGCPNEKDKSVITEFGECGDNSSGSDEWKEKTKIPRSVRFPEADQIVTQYFEPANPWEDVPTTTRSQLAAEYLESCRRHNTPCIDAVLQQIRELPECSIGGAARAPRLTLGECSLTGTAPVDALEALMRKVQFRRLELEHATIDDEGAEAMFDMIEYYESATVMCISGPRQFGIRGWQAASRLIKKSAELSELEVTDAPLEAAHAPVLARSLRAHSCRLRALCLQRVALCGEPLLCLVIALKSNSSIRELRLGDNRLTVSDAAQLASLLRYNTRIQLLDLSNNQIQDAGAAHLADALADQASQSPPSAAASPLSPHRCQVGGHEARGLAFLVLWNNQLTRNCAPYLSKALRSSQSLCVLNVGRNALGGEALRALARGGALLSLGLQAARLGPDAAPALAELVRADTKLQRLDLRENRLGSAGLQAILTAMKDNSTLTQIDLDEPQDTHLLAEDNEASVIRRLTREIRAMCRRNEPPSRHDEEGGHPVHRKISLTCHTACLLRDVPVPLPQGSCGAPGERRGPRLRSPAPSPAPSPAGSPVPALSRFMVTRVTPERDSSTDSSGSSTSSSTPTPTRLAYCPPSRFKVVQVMEPPQIQVHPASSQPRKSPSRFSVTRNYDSVYNSTPSPPPPSPTPIQMQPIVYTQLENDIVTQLKNEASQCKNVSVTQVKDEVLTQLKKEAKQSLEAAIQSKNKISRVETEALTRAGDEVTQVINESMIQLENEATELQLVPVTSSKNKALAQVKTEIILDSSESSTQVENEVIAIIKDDAAIHVENVPVTVKKAVTTQVRNEAMKQNKNEALSEVKNDPPIQVKEEVTAPILNTDTKDKNQPIVISRFQNEAVSQLVSAETIVKNNATALDNEASRLKNEVLTQFQNEATTLLPNETETQTKNYSEVQVKNEASQLKTEPVTKVRNVVTTQLKTEPATIIKIESTIQLKNDQATQVSANIQSSSQTQNEQTESKSISIETKTQDKNGSKIEIKTESTTDKINEPVESASRLKTESISQTKLVNIEPMVKTELPTQNVSVESSSQKLNQPVYIESKCQVMAITDTSSKTKVSKSLLPKTSITTIEESLTECDSESELCDLNIPEMNSESNISNLTKCKMKTVCDSSELKSKIESVNDDKTNAMVEYADVDVKVNTEPKIICMCNTSKPNIELFDDLTKTTLTMEAYNDSNKCKTSIDSSTQPEMMPLTSEFKSDTQLKSDKFTQELTESKCIKNELEEKGETKITNVICDLNVIDISIKNPTLVKSDLKYSDVVKSDKKVNSCDIKAKVVCDQNKDNAMKNIVAITEDLGNIIKEMQVLVKNRDSLEEIVPADSLVLKKNKSESSLDSPDLEVSRLMEKRREERSVFDSNSSLEISGSSMESLNEQNKTIQELDRRKSRTILSNESSMESASDATPVNSGNFLNLSLSSNESVSPIFGKIKVIHDSLSSLEASVSSLDSGRQDKAMVTSADSGIEYSLQHASEYREDNSSNEGTLTNNSSLKDTVKKPDGSQLDSVTSSPKRTSSLLDVPALKNKGLDRMRKISWVAPSSSFHVPRPEEKDAKPSHLEKLLSIFQHPSSIFSRSLTSEDEKRSASNTPPRKDSSLTSSFWSWGSTVEKTERDEDSSEATDSTLSERVQVSFVDESFSRKLDSKTPSTDTDNTLSEFQSFPTQESECVEERVTITTEDKIVQNLDLSVISNTSKQRSDIDREPKRSGDVDLLRDKESVQEKEEKELTRPRSFAAVLKSSGSENSLDKQNSPDNGHPVDKLPSKVIRGIKENISPENTLTSSMTNTKALAVELERQVRNPTVNIWEVTLKSEPKTEEIKVPTDLAPIATIEETCDEDNPLQLAYIDEPDVKIDGNLSIDSGTEIEKGKITDGIDVGKDALSYLIYENREFEIGAESVARITAQQGSLAQELKDAAIKEILDLSPELVVDESVQDNVFTAKEIIGLRTSPIIPERAKLKKSNSLEDLSQLQSAENNCPKTKTIAFKVPESTTPRDIPERRGKLRSRSGSSPKSLPESLNKPCPIAKMESILSKKKKKVSSLGKIARDSLLALNMSEEEIAEFRRSYKLTSVESLRSLESVSEDANSQSGNSVDSRCRACLRTSQESLMSLDSISEDCRCTEDCERPGKSSR